MLSVSGKMLSTVYTLIFGAMCVRLAAFSDHYVEVDLRHGIVQGYSPHVHFLEPPSPFPDRSCSAQAVIRIDFTGRYKGVKFLLEYGESPRLWTLDVSDSPAGDGFGGDNGTTSNMAEAHVHNRQLRVYGNELPGYLDASTNGGHLLRVVNNFVKKGARVTLDVSDERLEWSSGGRSRQVLESPYLFTLSGQKPAYGALDYSVYVGFNRVVAGPHRSGTGLCKVAVSLYEAGKSLAEKLYL